MTAALCTVSWPPVPAWLVASRGVPRSGESELLSLFPGAHLKGSSSFDVSGLPELLKGLMGDSLMCLPLLDVSTCNGGTIPKTKMSISSLPHDSNTVIHVAFGICVSDLFHKL